MTKNLNFEKEKCKELTVEDLVEDEFYFFEGNENYPNNEYIYQHNVAHLAITSNYFTTKYSWKLESNEKPLKIRLATDEEKQWLEECIKHNKFISKEKALKPKEIMKEENLVGRYLKALVDSPECTDYKKNDFVKIVEDVNGNVVNLEKSNYSATISRKDCWELMPISFTPDNIIPEYYEFIGDSNISFTNSKIYKINNPKNLESGENFIDNNNMLNGYSGVNHKYFKPSTKEAYDLQNKSTLPNSGIGTIKLKDLSYPDVIHIENAEQHKQLSFLNIYKYDPKYKYYLVGSGIAKERRTYENSMYTIYEFNQIEIMNKTENMEDLLELAKRRFPIGTKVKCAKHSNNHYFVKSISCKEDYIENGNLCYLYYNGNWSEIISLPETEEWIPKLGDYVVMLSNSGVNKKGETGQITEINLGNKSFRVKTKSSKDNICNWCELEHVRKCESYEIPKESNNTVLGVELVEGEYYKLTDKNDIIWIFKFKKIQNNDIYDYFSVSEIFYYKNNNALFEIEDIQSIEPASFSDRQWLNKCHELGEFISKEEALKSLVTWETILPNSYIMSCNPALAKVEKITLTKKRKTILINVDDQSSSSKQLKLTKVKTIKI